MRLSPHTVKVIKQAALLHDLGLLKIPTQIVNKPQKLNENEFNMIKEHPEESYRLLTNISLDQPIAEIVLQHHEMIDGSGYPRGLQGKDILIEAKIIAVANVVEAMTSPRPHQKAHSIEAALTEIKNNAGIKHDEKVVDLIMNL
jgi:HD-GYP domain-containing protein (c-di-GMP phosphodiesterase class II)